ncbi:putative transposable element, partial [Pseudoloma neurophilia]
GVIKEPSLCMTTINENFQEINDERKRFEIMFHAHSMTGHAGRDAMMDYIKNYANWPGLKDDATEFIQKCTLCRNYRKDKGDFRSYRSELGTSFSKIGIDLIGPLPKCEKGFRFIIAATDYTTRWDETRVLKSKKKEEIARFIFECIFLRHGPPREMISDQVTEFLNDLVTILCNKMKTKHSSASAYSPQCNGSVERFNRTFINKLAKFIKNDIHNWSDFVSTALYSYNISAISKI